MILDKAYDQIPLGDFVVYTWSSLLGLSFLIGLFLFLAQASRKKQDIAKLFYFSTAVFIISLIGSKIGYLLQFPNQLWQISNYLKTDGFTLYGGLLSGVLASYVLLKILRLDFWLLADMAVLPLSMGITLTRLGCFLIMDHPGAITNLPWAVIWPDGSSRHPVALYLVLNGLLMLGLFYFLRNKIKVQGLLFIYFLLYYSFARYWLDFSRAADLASSDPRWHMLTYSQWLSAGLFLISAVLFFKLRHRGFLVKAKNDKILT